MNELPSGWKTDRLKDVAEINRTSLPANTDPDYEFDYLEISNVNYYGVINPAAIERLRFEEAPSRARRRVGKEGAFPDCVPRKSKKWLRPLSFFGIYPIAV